MSGDNVFLMLLGEFYLILMDYWRGVSVLCCFPVFQVRLSPRFLRIALEGVPCIPLCLRIYGSNSSESSSESIVRSMCLQSVPPDGLVIDGCTAFMWICDMSLHR